MKLKSGAWIISEDGLEPSPTQPALIGNIIHLQTIYPDVLKPIDHLGCSSSTIGFQDKRRQSSSISPLPQCFSFKGGLLLMNAWWCAASLHLAHDTFIREVRPPLTMCWLQVPLRYSWGHRRVNTSDVDHRTPARSPSTSDSLSRQSARGFQTHLSSQLCFEYYRLPYGHCL
ncbi:hypothetical protein CPB83DRAFT_569922 [Crepidotus variabilis]|uniref:Uncharacterized protein n=1 Tax=Crepidotus variabilis TaxID=179855 RepID=A0A9P6JLQ8_9AGAR|nr:hypothetical protein CPB83DRAFT_569922 [Crepidotus variabilis]